MIYLFSTMNFSSNKYKQVESQIPRGLFSLFIKEMENKEFLFGENIVFHFITLTWEKW